MPAQPLIFGDLNFETYIEAFAQMAYLAAKRRGFYGPGYDRTAACVDLSDEVAEFFLADAAGQPSELGDVIINALSIYYWLKRTGRWQGQDLGAEIIAKMRFNAERTDPAKRRQPMPTFKELLQVRAGEPAKGANDVNASSDDSAGSTVPSGNRPGLP